MAHEVQPPQLDALPFSLGENSAVENRGSVLPCDRGAGPDGLEQPRYFSQFSDFCSDCPLQRELSILRCDKAFWKSMHQKALEREAILKTKVDELEAKLRLREKQLFGRKTEKGKKNNPSCGSGPNENKRPRGQQPGSKGHGRRDYSHLPAKEEIHEIPDDECCCPKCGLQYEPFPGTDDSELIEIEVKAHRRVIRRKRYKRTCKCENLPAIVTAPAPPKLIPKGRLGISVWVTILLDKFLLMNPTYRLLTGLKTHQLDIAQGTVTDGLKCIAPVFTPIYEAIIEKNLQENRWHADETRWLVFASVEGKIGYKWYMWVFSSPSAVVYKLDKSRCAQVPIDHFGPVEEGILSVDRYSSYKAMAKVLNIILAFCWAHVRRDFLNVAGAWPKLEAWGLEWVEQIKTLYHLNDLRLKALDQPHAFREKNRNLNDALEQMAQKRDTELNQTDLHPACKKVLNSLKNHWEGLIVFFHHPEVPMDNNKAERLERVPALGRKDFYGSGALWSGYLCAVMMSILQTLAFWKINPRAWMTAYLEACAANGGKAPQDVQAFLPWNMSETQRKVFALEPHFKDSS